MSKSDSTMDTEGWKTINWRQAERYVFKLQKRIYVRHEVAYQAHERCL